MNMRAIMETVRPLVEVSIGGGIDKDYLDHLTQHADYTNPQTDLFPDEVPTLDPNLPKGMKLVGKLGTFRVVHVVDGAATQSDKGEETYAIFDRNRPIAWVGLGPPKRGYDIKIIDNKFTGYQVYSVYIDEDYRGKNLGVVFYKWLLTNVCDYLIADELQTRGGVKLWKRLQNSRQFDVEVYDDAKYQSRRRWAGKDFDQVYQNDMLVPWVTLRGKANRLVFGSDDE